LAGAFSPELMIAVARARSMRSIQTLDLGAHILCLDKEESLVYRKKTWAVNSAVECHPHTVEVTGSNPVPPTMTNRVKALLEAERAAHLPRGLFCADKHEGV
jgi:hypothetical protein